MCVRARGKRRALLALTGACALLLCALLWAGGPGGAVGPAGPGPARLLPLRYWAHRKYSPHLYTQSGCVVMPGIELKSWQSVYAGDVTVLVYAAHWDARVSPRVRLLVHVARALHTRTPALQCLFWYYSVGDPLPAAARWQPAARGAALRVVTCVPPTAPPAAAELGAVNLVARDFTCGVPPNVLNIQGLLPANGGEAVRRRAAGACAVWRRRGDAAARLVEWLTLLRHFGVEVVYLYISDAHENVLRVLDYFSWRGNVKLLLHVTPYASPPSDGLTPHAPVTPRSTRRTPRNLLSLHEFTEEQEKFNETFDATHVIDIDDMLPYNDCLYRAVAERIVWIALLDLDEIIVPLRHGTWWKLGARESRAALDAGGALPDVLAFRRLWFPAPLQPSPATHSPPATPARVLPGRMFAYEWRAPTPRDHDGITGKLLRTESITCVGARNVSCISDTCSVWNVDSDTARVHAYPARCGGGAGRRRERGARGRGRGGCRALRPLAVRDTELRARWQTALNDTQHILEQLQLQTHSHFDLDNE